MRATWGGCTDSDLGCFRKLNSPFSAFSIHDRSCLTPPKGLTPPVSGPCLARFTTVPHPARGRLESSKATQIARKTISLFPWKEREDSNWARPSKTKMTVPQECLLFQVTFSLRQNMLIRMSTRTIALSLPNLKVSRCLPLKRLVKLLKAPCTMVRQDHFPDSRFVRGRPC
jgi:hypothetical protein